MGFLGFSQTKAVSVYLQNSHCISLYFFEISKSEIFKDSTADDVIMHETGE